MYNVKKEGNMQQVRIKLQNISKYYYSETAVTQALQGINLEFRMGEFVAITGESGSGKSTLLRIISGMDTLMMGSFMWMDSRHFSMMKMTGKNIVVLRSALFFKIIV